MFVFHLQSYSNSKEKEMKTTSLPCLFNKYFKMVVMTCHSSVNNTVSLYYCGRGRLKCSKRKSTKGRELLTSTAGPYLCVDKYIETGKSICDPLFNI